MTKRTTRTETPKPRVSTVAELARALAAHVRTVRRWKARGMPVLPDGGYDVEAVRAWSEQHRSAAARRGPPADDAEERRELRRASEPSTTEPATPRGIEINRMLRAKLLALQVREREEQLIDRRVVEQLLVDRITEFQRMLAQLARRLAPQLAGQTDVRAIAKLLAQAHREALAVYKREPDLD